MAQSKDPKGFLVVLPGEIIKIPQDSDKSWLTYQQFSNLIVNVTDMVIVEENWQPMQFLFENRCFPQFKSRENYRKMPLLQSETQKGVKMRIGLTRRQKTTEIF